MSVCEYCHYDRDGYIKLLPRKGRGNAAVYPRREGSRLLVTGPFKTQVSIPINYCPICGRELNPKEYEDETTFE